jgi:hypothetical protein
LNLEELIEPRGINWNLEELGLNLGVNKILNLKFVDGT